MIEKLNYEPMKDPSFMFGNGVLYDKINEIIDAINKLETEKIIDAANKLKGGEE